MHRAIHRCALPLLMLSTCLLFACEEDGRACTLIGCSDSLSFVLPADAPPGEWTIELDADGMSWTCTATLPLATPADAGCSGFDVVPVIDAAGTFRGIRLEWAPDMVTARLFHDGELLDEVSQAPDYAQNYPNGKDCDLWPCRNASVQLRLRGAR